MLFGDLLRSFRKQRKINQSNLAEMLCVHRNTISSWERGERLPVSKSMVLEIAHFLQLNEKDKFKLLEASLTAIVPYWGVPFQRNHFFIGREIILTTLNEFLGIKIKKRRRKILSDQWSIWYWKNAGCC